LGVLVLASSSKDLDNALQAGWPHFWATNPFFESRCRENIKLQCYVTKTAPN